MPTYAGNTTSGHAGRAAWLVEAFGQGDWCWNVQTGAVEYTGEWLRRLGYEDAEVPKDTSFWSIYVHPEDYERVRQAFEEHLGGQTPSAEAEYRVRTKAGEWRWVFCRAKVVERTPDGKPLFVYGVNTDISGMKRHEEHRQRRELLANVARVAGAVAHDFNNLLTVINGYSEIALAALDPRDPLHESIREIKSAGDRAALLTRHLLSFSGRQVMQARPLSLNDLLVGLEAMLRRVAGDEVALVLECDPEGGVVKADAVQMQQVITNLAMNARDAMPDGGRMVISTASVELGEKDRGDGVDVPPGRYLRLSVQDTGVGMDAETLNRLFEPFFTTKGKGKAAGLGLSTVYGIVGQSGGGVSVESRPGEGTVVHVYLPLAEGQEAHVEPSPPSAALPRAETILLVEDQPEVRQLALRALTRQGYRVMACASGDEALEAAGREGGPIDLLLTDVVMPGMAGPALARAMTALRPGVRVLLMSGYSDESALPGVTTPPGLDYIQKPFTPDHLARKVREALDARPAAPRVLVVDDEAEIRRLLRTFLEQAGYSVAEASNGRQAMAEVDAGGVSLVITDLVMPEQEGIETIREVRRRHRDVKIIAMSGAFGGRFLRTAEMLGAHATLAKPVRAEQLVRAVEGLLGAA